MKQKASLLCCHGSVSLRPLEPAGTPRACHALTILHSRCATVCAESSFILFTDDLTFPMMTGSRKGLNLLTLTLLSSSPQHQLQALSCDSSAPVEYLLVLVGQFCQILSANHGCSSIQQIQRRQKNNNPRAIYGEELT